LQTVFKNEVKSKSRGVYDVNKEYMKVIIQFGYLVMFSCANPLFPIVLIVYNWVEMKLDIIEYTGSNNRPSKEKVTGLGAWMNVLSFLSIISSIINCFTIVVVSKNLHELAYELGSEMSHHSVCFGTSADLSSALNYSLRTFDDAHYNTINAKNYSAPVCTTDCLHEIQQADHGRLFDFANEWCVSGMFAVLLVVFLEHLVIVLKIILTLAIPDMPAWVRATLRANNKIQADLLAEGALIEDSPQENHKSPIRSLKSKRLSAMSLLLEASREREKQEEPPEKVMNKMNELRV